MIVGSHVSAAPYAELAAINVADASLGSVVARVADLASRAVRGAEEASVTLVGDGGTSAAAATGPLALDLDEWQYRRGLGPCLEAVGEKTTVSAADLTTDIRWYEWTAHAVASGARSFLSIGLPVAEDMIGAFTVYGRTVAAFDDDAILQAQVFAEAAAVWLANILAVRRGRGRRRPDALERTQSVVAG
jgi:GAF domain-containing protein